MRKLKSGIVLGVILTILSTFPLIAYASEVNDADGQETMTDVDTKGEIVSETVEKGNTVNEARNGILQVNLVYVDSDGNEHVVRGGSGFLIGNEEGANYVITSNTNVTVTDDLRESVGKEYKVTKTERKNMQFVVQVVVKRDVVVDASVTTYSEQVNFAVLHLSQTIYDRSPLIIEKDPDMTKEMDAIYTLGFPEEIQSEQDVSYYTYEDVSVMNGIISKKVTMDGTLYIQHSAAVTAGNAGGPILNQYGQVVGVNQIVLEDGYNYSVHISEVTSVLDALGIPYTEVVPEEIVEPVNTETLQSAIETAREKNLKGYTDESIAEYNAALEQASVLLENENITEEDVTNGLTLISKANATLVVKSNNYLFLIGGGVIFVLVVLILLLVVFAIKKNSKNSEGEKASPKEAKTKKNTKKNTYESLVAEPPFQPAAKTQETSVLNSAMGFDEGETMVLGNSMQLGGARATLRRLKNNETINIQKKVFYIGKDGLKVDYCIKGNSSISRSHAVIKQIDEEFYLEDLQATNGTYHNDVRLQPSQSVKLISGDRIKLADEEFVFSV
ncbi:MAG: trypsin-like peptidase domain-containing protein [Bacillota bacterium]|nr:trypsin-like peptidase domain-containing protein [Bacillota bacterium]